MRDDYKINGETKKVEVEVEKAVYESLLSMEKYSKLSRSEITNTALRRFISSHKDFLPPEEPQKR
ncbi:MAG: hypothetical protein P4M08_00855 [Oligoflexia bacterium]|nr:hypothetical protein [Oligoflexia bacterium]